MGIPDQLEYVAAYPKLFDAQASVRFHAARNQHLPAVASKERRFPNHQPRRF
jgi:hypothetical protein